jgi:sigma-B regulation protein RsbU (phosphoserine phosphatase)
MMADILLHLTESSPEPLHSQISRQLRNRILSGDLPEGCEIPPAQRFGREHRVSPREVQRALAELAAEGLLELDGDAFRVATVTAEQRRALAQRRLLDDLRQQELSLRELELARDIQRRLLPPARVDSQGVSVVSRWFPARFVAGDFYDVLRHTDGSIGVVVADVAGKGFAASVIMASVKAMTPFIAAEHGVADTLRELNRRLFGERPAGSAATGDGRSRGRRATGAAAVDGQGRGLGSRQFVALAYARVSSDATTVELANAGMPDPFVVQPGGVAVPLEVPGARLPLGIREDVPYSSVTWPLAKDARLLLFSDGIPEARRPSGEPLGYEGLAGLLARSAASVDLAVEEWLDGALDEVQRLTGPALDDDWTAVAVERRRLGEER